MAEMAKANYEKWPLMTRWNIFAALTLAAAVSEESAAQAQLDTARILDVLESERLATKAPGTSIAVIAGDRMFVAAVGVESQETRRPMTPASLVRIGSVSKMFTGLTAAILHDQGKLDLDQPIARYARGLAPALGQRSLRSLLSHTGGFINEAAADGPQDPSALATRVRGWTSRYLFAPEGDVYSYSSPGYWLAGYVLEQSSREPYPALVERVLLRPLGMQRSTFSPTTAMTWPLALDHRVTGDTVRVIRPYQNDATTWPSGGLFSNVEELAMLARALMGEGGAPSGSIIPKGALERLRAARDTAPGNSCSYTFGLSVCRSGGLQSMGHYGFRVGSGAVFTVIPGRRIAVIILSNRNGGIFRRTEDAVLDMLLPGERGSDVAEGDSQPARRVLTVADRRIAGRYVSGGDTLHLMIRNDSLTYGYRGSVQPAGLSGTDMLQIFGEGGDVVQQFQLIRGARSKGMYLTDGLNAFRRIQ
jgi:CubicO group peptidase (beta-lactamase class C family)